MGFEEGRGEGSTKTRLVTCLTEGGKIFTFTPHEDGLCVNEIETSRMELLDKDVMPLCLGEDIYGTILFGLDETLCCSGIVELSSLLFFL